MTTFDKTGWCNDWNRLGRGNVFVRNSKYRGRAKVKEFVSGAKTKEWTIYWKRK